MTLLLTMLLAAVEGVSLPPVTALSPEHPLILLQVSAAFGDTDEAPEGTDRFAEADRHGFEIVHLWNFLPEDIRPCPILKKFYGTTGPWTRMRRWFRAWMTELGDSGISFRSVEGTGNLAPTKKTGTSGIKTIREASTWTVQVKAA